MHCSRRAQIANASSTWHFLNEEKIPRGGSGHNGLATAAVDEIGLDAAYLVSVVVEQALAAHGAAGKEDARRKQRPRFGTAAANKKVRGGCLAARRRADGRDGPEAVRQLLCDVYAEAVAADIADDSELVRFVLSRLHAAAASSSSAGCRPSLCRRRRCRRGLGRPLSLFMRRLYDVSHRTCWHLDEWRRRRDRDELDSLGAFARVLCNDATVRPAEALLDAMQKGQYRSLPRTDFRCFYLQPELGKF